jgi:RNA polymerase sigma factor (sigma-70 family)
MKASMAGRSAVWTAAVSASVAAPHAVLLVFGVAAGKEVFDLLRARSDRISVMAFVRATRAGTYLSIDSSGAVPGMILQAAALPAGQRGDVEGARHVPGRSDIPKAAAHTDPGHFCVQCRADWLCYARSLTNDWADADDAVQHAAEKILKHYRDHGTLCPVGKDPVGYAKKTIAHYLIDRHRRRQAQSKHARSLLFAPVADVAEDIADQLIARDAREFVDSLEPQERLIAVLRWVEGLEPKEIARLLEVNNVTVRTTLHRITGKMRRQLGIAAKPARVLREGTA